MIDFKSYINDYPDFPSKGIIFKDILPILSDPLAYDELINKLASIDLFKNSEAIIAIDARGFLFGSALAIKLAKPLILARKPGKLPGELISKSYDLEYGSNTLCIQKDLIEKFNSYIIVDDLLATGGTIECLANIIKENKKSLIGSVVVVELTKLNGRQKFDFPIKSLISY